MFCRPDLLYNEYFTWAGPCAVFLTCMILKIFYFESICSTKQQRMLYRQYKTNNLKLEMETKENKSIHLQPNLITHACKQKEVTELFLFENCYCEKGCSLNVILVSKNLVQFIQGYL